MKFTAMMAFGVAALACACGGSSGREDGDGGTDVPDVPHETDAVHDPDVADPPPDDSIHDVPADPPSEPPVHPDDCILVDNFQCGFEARCESGVIYAEWHEHVFTGDVEDIVPYDCSHECEYGCEEGTIMDWPSDGATLVEDYCLGPPEESDDVVEDATFDV